MKNFNLIRPACPAKLKERSRKRSRRKQSRRIYSVIVLITLSFLFFDSGFCKRPTVHDVKEKVKEKATKIAKKPAEIYLKKKLGPTEKEKEETKVEEESFFS